MVRGSLEQEAFLPSFLSSGSLRPRRRSCEAMPRNRSWHQLCQDTQCNRWNRGDWWDSEKVFFSENIATGFHHRSSWIWKINHWQHDCRFLGPRGPLRVPLMSARLSVRPSVRPQQTFQLMEIHYKSLHHYIRPIKSYIFWRLMTPTIHWRSEMTNTHTNTHIHK